MSVSSVSEQGRATQGVKLIRVDEGDKIAAITKLDEEPEVTEEIVSETEGQENQNPTDSESATATDNPVIPDTE
jgi:DNA gyrase subunit A